LAMVEGRGGDRAESRQVRESEAFSGHGEQVAAEVERGAVEGGKGHVGKQHAPEGSPARGAVAIQQPVEGVGAVAQAQVDLQGPARAAPQRKNAPGSDPERAKAREGGGREQRRDRRFTHGTSMIRVAGSDRAKPGPKACAGVRAPTGEVARTHSMARTAADAARRYPSPDSRRDIRWSPARFPASTHTWDLSATEEARGEGSRVEEAARAHRDISVPAMRPVARNARAAARDNGIPVTISPMPVRRCAAT